MIPAIANLAELTLANKIRAQSNATAGVGALESTRKVEGVSEQVVAQ